MKILKILGIVAAVHVVAVVLLFAIQGCSSTNKTEATPAQVDNTAAPAQLSPTPVASSPVTPMNGADLNPATAPAPTATVSFNDSQTLYSPTRPGTPAADAIATSAPVSNVTPAATYSVVKGDSLSRIAAKYHITAAELAKANNLRLSTPLQIGHKLIIPGKPSAAPAGGAETAPGGASTYTVRSGDSLKLIAKRSGTTVSALKSLNRLKSDSVRVGQELRLPPGATPITASAPPDMTSATFPAAPSEAVKGATGVTYTVKSGEKLGTIARKYGVTVGELATANNISDPGKIRAGQQLVIPNASAAGATSPKAGPAAPPPPDQDLDNGPKPSTEEPPVIKVDSGSSAPSSTAAPAPADSGATQPSP